MFTFVATQTPPFLPFPFRPRRLRRRGRNGKKVGARTVFVAPNVSLHGASPWHPTVSTRPKTTPRFCRLSLRERAFFRGAKDDVVRGRVLSGLAFVPAAVLRSCCWAVPVGVNSGRLGPGLGNVQLELRPMDFPVRRFRPRTVNPRQVVRHLESRPRGAAGAFDAWPQISRLRWRG